MAIWKSMLMTGTVLLFFSFIGSVNGQDYQGKKSISYEIMGGMPEKNDQRAQYKPAKTKELMIFAQSWLQSGERQRLLTEKNNIEFQIDNFEKHLKEFEAGVINSLEHIQMNYEQWVRKNGMDSVSESLLNDIRDRKERGELEINQKKRKLATLYEELKKIQNKLKELNTP